MSVIIESQAGDELVCIEQFSATPQGVPFCWDTCHTFRVGERIRYVSCYRDEYFKDHPVGWMVVFDGEDGRRYAATQTYFVTQECWRGLKKSFARRLLREPKRRKHSSK
jgi:hypothetical protein